MLRLSSSPCGQPYRTVVYNDDGALARKKQPFALLMDIPNLMDAMGSVNGLNEFRRIIIVSLDTSYPAFTFAMCMISTSRIAA
jgi:hypothetical protein